MAHASERISHKKSKKHTTMLALAAFAAVFAAGPKNEAYAQTRGEGDSRVATRLFAPNNQGSAPALTSRSSAIRPTVVTQSFGADPSIRQGEYLTAQKVAEAFRRFEQCGEFRTEEAQFDARLLQAAMTYVSHMSQEGLQNIPADGINQEDITRALVESGLEVPENSRLLVNFGVIEEGQQHLYAAMVSGNPRNTVACDNTSGNTESQVRYGAFGQGVYGEQILRVSLVKDLGDGVREITSVVTPEACGNITFMAARTYRIPEEVSIEEESAPEPEVRYIERPPRTIVQYRDREVPVYVESRRDDRAGEIILSGIFDVAAAYVGRTEIDIDNRRYDNRRYEDRGRGRDYRPQRPPRQREHPGNRYHPSDPRADHVPYDRDTVTSPSGRRRPRPDLSDVGPQQPSDGGQWSSGVTSGGDSTRTMGFRNRDQFSGRGERGMRPDRVRVERAPTTVIADHEVGDVEIAVVISRTAAAQFPEEMEQYLVVTNN